MHAAPVVFAATDIHMKTSSTLSPHKKGFAFTLVLASGDVGLLRTLWQHARLGSVQARCKDHRQVLHMSPVRCRISFPWVTDHG